MKKVTALLIAMAIAAFMTACSEGGNAPAENAPTTATESAFSEPESANDVNEETRQATSSNGETEETQPQPTAAEENSGSSLRPQKSGFDESTVQKVLSGNYIIPVPDYWAEDTPDEFGLDYRGYAETDGKVAMLMIQSMTDHSDPVTFEVLYDDKDNMADALTYSISSMDSVEFIGYDIYETEDLKGMTFTYTFVSDEYGVSGKGTWLVFPSEKDSKWIEISLIASDNTEYCYDDDFAQILAAIRKNDENPSPVPKGIRPEFKEAMDSYEAFFDEYCALMKKYSENPYDFSLLAEYLEYTDKYSEAMAKLDELGEEEMSDEEALYYTQVMFRIEQKLLSSITG